MTDRFLHFVRTSASCARKQQFGALLLAGTAAMFAGTIPAATQEIPATESGSALAGWSHEDLNDDVSVQGVMDPAGLGG